jgi:extradiol dioxygenase family protein
MLVALGIQHARHMRHIVIRGLSGCIIFFHIISQMAQCSKKKVTEHKVCVLIHPVGVRLIHVDGRTDM